MTEGSTIHYRPPPPAAPVAWHIIATRYERAWVRWWKGGTGDDCWEYGTKTLASLRALVKLGHATVTRTGG